MEFLNLVDGADGQSAVVCQSQTVKILRCSVSKGYNEVPFAAADDKMHR